MTDQKRIGILTSGGDCAGLNAVLRAVTFRAINGYGWRVFGIRQGTHGLTKRPIDYQELQLEDFTGHVLRMGGTILGTISEGDPFAFRMPDGKVKDLSDQIIDGYRELGLDALIVVGGDGSLDIARRIAIKGGLNLIGIPKTIDNDVGLTENAVGYGTAVDVATEALDRLQPTAASHSRVMVLEVMGRDAGHIALAAGVSGGADVILIPEIPYSLVGLARQIERVKEQGRNFSLVVVAEAVTTEQGELVTKSVSAGQTRYGGIGHYIGDKIAELTGAETRVTVLGHTQRGGAPSPRDRLFAAAFGVHAVDLVAQGKFDRMVAWWHRACVDVPLADIVGHAEAVDPHGALANTARGLGIYLGDMEGIADGG